MGKIIFILGGARSGKSSKAIRLVEELGVKNPVFIATGEPLDEEMSERIKRHKRSRPGHWKTFEEPLHVTTLLKKITSSHDAIVIDCLTLLVSNLMLKHASERAIQKEIKNMIAELKRSKKDAIIVSNEVGLGIVPDNKLARDFRDVAGGVNRLVAEAADKVVYMVSGIPWEIK